MTDRFAGWRPLVERLGLGAVLLYFGAAELTAPSQWAGYIPPQLHLLPQVPLLLAHGVVLFAVGGLLALGAWSRPMAWLGVALLVSVVLGLLLSGGGTSLYVRDLGLTALALAFALEREPGPGLDAWLEAAPRGRRAPLAPLRARRAR